MPLENRMHTTTRSRRMSRDQPLLELERLRARVQSDIDAAELGVTTPAQLNDWLANRVLIDRAIGRLHNAEGSNSNE
jgi:hypothetical protein